MSEMSDIKKADLLPARSARSDGDEVKKIPNIYALIEEFFDKNSEFNFSENETKLYFFLVHFNNSIKWKRSFRQSFRQIHEKTGIMKSTIKRSIKRLVDAGLIEATLGKSGDKTDVNNKTLFRVLVTSYFGDGDDSGSVPQNGTHQLGSVPQNGTHIEDGSVPQNGTHKNDRISTGSVPQNGTIIRQYSKYSLSYIAKLENFDFYHKDLHREKRKFLDDENFIRDQEKDFPDIDVKKTLEKACRDYYSRPAGHAKILRDCKRDQLPPDYHRIFAEAIADHRNWVKKEKAPTVKAPINGGSRKPIVFGELVTDPDEFKRQAEKESW